MKDVNVLLVWDRMGDYHRARWFALQKEMEGINVYGADMAGKDQLYRWARTIENPLYIQLSNKKPQQFDVLRIWKFIKLLNRNHIGFICIAGYGSLEYMFFLLYGRLTGRKVILFAESWYRSSLVLDLFKSFLLKACCDGFLVSGKRAHFHFTDRLKIDSTKILTGYSVVDNDHFKNRTQQIEIPSKKILCVARFVPEKNLEFLIDAFKRSKMPGLEWELIIAGGGASFKQLEERIEDAHVKLLNWVDYEKVPSLFHSAQIFILPSTFEPWGLVVNEAMAAGLPLVLSQEVGSAPDLLQVGKNGWSFMPNDQKGLIDILNLISVTSLERLRAMASESERIIDQYRISLFSTNLKKLIFETKSHS